MSKSRKLIKIFVVLAFLFFVVPAVIRFFVDRSILANIEETKQQLRDMNVATDLEELQAKLPDDPGLFEAADTYQEAFDLMVEIPGDLKYPVPIYVENFLLNPSETGADAYIAQAKLHLDANAAALGLLHEVASLEGAQFELNAAAGMYAERPHLHDLAQASYLVCLQAQIAAAEGDTEAATASLVTAFRIANALNFDPTLSSQAERISINRNACHSLAEALSFTELTEEQLDRINMEIDIEQARTSFRLGVSGDLILLDETLLQFQTGEFTADFSNGMPEQDRAFTYLHLIPFGTSWFNTNRRMNLDFTRLIMEELDKEYSFYLDGAEALNAHIEQLPTIFVLSKMVLPSFANAGRYHLRDIAYLRAAKSMIAIEQYRLKTGSLPNALSDISPEQTSILSDPINGTLLNYHAESDRGFVIYSVGYNSEDDNAERLATESEQRDNGDWYLRVRR